MPKQNCEDYMYKLKKDQQTNELTNEVFKVTDGINIPFDPANTDYQEYLKWLAEGNEPLPADEV